MNLGCGRDIKEGWVNVDLLPGDGVDLVLDLDQPKPFDLADADSVDEFMVSHLIEHLHHPLSLAEAMWRAAKPGATAIFRTPHGASDDADEDPTHTRRMFQHSWDYFGQPAYHQADYGYRGDWRVEEVLLRCRPERMGDSDAETYELIRMERNVVVEMLAALRAIKPARPQVPDETVMRITIEAVT
jgi:hypothetical protein